MAVGVDRGAHGRIVPVVVPELVVVGDELARVVRGIVVVSHLLRPHHAVMAGTKVDVDVLRPDAAEDGPAVAVVAVSVQGLLALVVLVGVERQRLAGGGEAGWFARSDLVTSKALAVD